MKKHLPIIVKFEVKHDKIEFVKGELLKILLPTRKEKGCILYQLHQDIENSNIFMFYEIWETTECWKSHDLQQHIIDFKLAIKDSIIDISFNKLSIL